MSYKKLESHSSKNTNDRLDNLFYMADVLSLESSNSLRPVKIQAYYNALDQIYTDTADIVKDNTKIEEAKEKFEEILDLIENHPNCRTKKAARALLKQAKVFNRELVCELQKTQFFFRTRMYHQKGLSNFKNGEEDEEDEDI